MKNCKQANLRNKSKIYQSCTNNTQAPDVRNLFPSKYDFKSCLQANSIEEVKSILNIKSPVIQLAESQLKNLITDNECCIIPTQSCNRWTRYMELFKKYSPVFGLSALASIIIVVLGLHIGDTVCNTETNHISNIPHFFNMIDHFIANSEENVRGVF